MKAIELVKISTEAMKMMSESGIKSEDWRHVKMYEEYVRMRADKEKFRWVMAYLAEKYMLSESSVRRVIKRLSGEVRI